MLITIHFYRCAGYIFMTDNDKIQDTSKKSNFLKKLKFWNLRLESWGAISTVLLFGLLQEPIIRNLQLLIYLPNQFPSFEVGYWIIDVFLSFIASIFLLYEAKSFKTKAWWFSFVCMVLPYIYLTYIGVYFDSTDYLIATDKGLKRIIRDDESVVYMLLTAYVFGSAQLISWLTYYIFYLTQRFSWLAFKSNAKKYLKSIVGITDNK
jgi:hypothetical protein